MFRKNRESKLIFSLVVSIFIAFLIIPTISILYKSFEVEGAIGLKNYKEVILNESFMKSLKNSFVISGCTALITTFIAFILSYTINNTNIDNKLKKVISNITTLPMLLPTITYGFAIIYSFGKQGLITKILGFELFNIYGFYGLLLGYTIYTLPVAFLLVNNTFKYIDKKYLVVSRVMGDSTLKTFYITTLRPLAGTLLGAFIQAFFLSFTDFGIPASVGGNFTVVSTALYNEMLGSLPNFNNGAVIAIVMLIPSIVGIIALTYLEKYNFRYNKVSDVEINKNKVRDAILGVVSLGITGVVLSIFAVIFIVPFVKSWPYNMSFTVQNIKNIMATSDLNKIYINSLVIAIMTSILGTIIAYGAALITSRGEDNKKFKSVIDSIALITNTIPGMVLGIAFLLNFSGSGLQNTFIILITCNIVHFFSTPYLMMKNSLSKMNNSFETTAQLLGDSWIKTITRVVTPNVKSTILEVLSYYFINSMVTISAVIFLTGAKTMVVTTKIKELQHYAKFDEIFILSVLIFTTNIIAKSVIWIFAHQDKVEEIKDKILVQRGIKISRKLIMATVFIVVIIGFTIGGSSLAGSKSDEVIIYSNADEEVVVAMKNSLDKNGYEGKYIIQSFGTSELGGKLLAEGTNIEADLITMSSYYIDTAQEKHNMFNTLEVEVDTIDEYPDYQLPITALQGSLIINSEILKQKNLEAPKSIKDLARPEYKGLISIPDITGSSTGWLLIQGIINEYGEEQAKKIMTNIINNAGPHLESSGSAPIKKVRAGEVAVAFGLRHQVIKDKQNGLPIDSIDPIEGNFSLAESIALIDKENKDEEKEKLVNDIAKCIIENARAEIVDTYQNILYKGEKLNKEISAKYPNKFNEKLTIDLLEKHKNFSEDCK